MALADVRIDCGRTTRRVQTAIRETAALRVLLPLCMVLIVLVPLQHGWTGGVVWGTCGQLAAFLP